jgi:hypothetical protein
VQRDQPGLSDLDRGTRVVTPLTFVGIDAGTATVGPASGADRVAIARPTSSRAAWISASMAPASVGRPPGVAAGGAGDHVCRAPAAGRA